MSTDLAPDSAFALSFFGRPAGQLPLVPLYDSRHSGVREKMLLSPGGVVDQRTHPGASMIIGKPAPFVRALVDAVDEAIRAQSPRHGLSTMQRTWLACCVTAVLVTHSIC